MLIGSKEEYSAFEVANTPHCRPMYLDAEVFATLIRNTDCKYFFKSETFILAKLGSISFTGIVLKS